MKIKRKLKLTDKGKFVIKICIFILILLLIPIILYKVEESNLNKLNYSKESSNYIIRTFQYNRIKEIGENLTLNAAFMSPNYMENNFEHYKTITYVDNVDLIYQINKLIEIGYSDSDINTILKYGENEDINKFLTHEYVENISKIMVKDYSKIKNIDRYIAYQYENFCSWDDAIRYVNLNLDLDDYEVVNEISTYSVTELVNKNNQLTSDYVPTELVTLDKTYSKSGTDQLAKDAADAFIKMVDAATADGYSIKSNSAYRSYEDQQKMYSLYENAYGSAYALKYVAKPGFSEHQTGLAIDIMSTNSNIFADSKEFSWVTEHAAEYGFILRYPKSKTSLTRYGYESWHYRYVGIDIAKDVKEKKLTYDEYYMIYIER